MYPYGSPPPRPRARVHPTLGAFLGLIVLGVALPYVLPYGLAGFAGLLLLAGFLAGAVARGGGKMGAGAGARAAGGFMTLLLVAWTVLLLNDQGFLNLTSSPEMAEFVPYVLVMENLWERVSLVMQPILAALLSLTGGDLFVELLLLIALPAILAAVGGGLAGAAVGRAAPRPAPMMARSGYGPAPQGGYGGNVTPHPDAGYACPWCGLRVLPHMVKCWNCAGPLQMPPPPAEG